MPLISVFSGNLLSPADDDSWRSRISLVKYASINLLINSVYKAGCFAISVLQMYCYYIFSVALPHCVVGWSACVSVVFPDLTHLICCNLNSKQVIFSDLCYRFL